MKTVLGDLVAATDVGGQLVKEKAVAGVWSHR